LALSLALTLALSGSTGWWEVHIVRLLKEKNKRLERCDIDATNHM
jgi:hypothetical protein